MKPTGHGHQRATHQLPFSFCIGVPTSRCWCRLIALTISSRRHIWTLTIASFSCATLACIGVGRLPSAVSTPLSLRSCSMRDSSVCTCKHTWQQQWLSIKHLKVRSYDLFDLDIRTSCRYSQDVSAHQKWRTQLVTCCFHWWWWYRWEMERVGFNPFTP